MTKKQEQVRKNRQIVEDEISKIAEIRPWRRPLPVIDALTSASLLDELERTNLLLGEILKMLGGSKPAEKPASEHILNKILRRVIKRKKE